MRPALSTCCKLKARCTNTASPTAPFPVMQNMAKSDSPWNLTWKIKASGTTFTAIRAPVSSLLWDILSPAICRKNLQQTQNRDEECCAIHSLGYASNLTSNHRERKLPLQATFGSLR